MTDDAYKRQFDALRRLLGGDSIASRAANALMRNDYAEPEKLLRATYKELAELRTVGVEAALRVGELRGALRPGFRAPVDATGPLLDKVYSNITMLVFDGELAHCSRGAVLDGGPPELYATMRHGDRFSTLVLTASEITPAEQKGGL